MGHGVVQTFVTGELVCNQQAIAMAFCRLNHLIFQRMHVDFLRNFDSRPMTLLVLSQSLSFGHEYHKK